MFTTTKEMKQLLQVSTSPTIQPHFVSLLERRKAYSLEKVALLQRCLSPDDWYGSCVVWYQDAVKVAHKFEMKPTVVAADQVPNEFAFGLCEDENTPISFSCWESSILLQTT